MPEKHLAMPEGYLHSLVSINTRLWSEGNCAPFELQKVKWVVVDWVSKE